MAKFTWTSATANIERLQRAIEILRTVPAERLVMGNWRSFKLEAFPGRGIELEDHTPGEWVDDWAARLNGYYGKGLVTPDALQQDCGTAACAIGWITADPRVIAEGFSYDSSTLSYEISEDYAYFSWEAVSEYFAISRQDATQLFGGDAYYKATPEQVIERLQSLIDYQGDAQCL
jgi:hypothetical protein